MDLKDCFPSSLSDNELAPPTYAESQYSGPSDQKAGKNSSHSLGTSHNNSVYSLQIQQQLSSLTTTLTSIGTQRTLLSNAQDEKILGLLTSKIQQYISGFATSGSSKGTLILVPWAAIKGQNAVPTDFHVDKNDEYNRLAKIIDDLRVVEEYHKAKEDYGFGYEEDNERENLLYWNDKTMTNRLAGYLRPLQPARASSISPATHDNGNSVPPSRQLSLSSTGGSGRSFFNWGKKKQQKVAPAIEPPRKEVHQSIPQTEQAGVIMTVAAQRVFFEVENDFGILEDKTGYAVVVKLRIT